MAHDKQLVRLRRKRGIRVRISGSAERPRLTVFRSSKHIYAQVIDDNRSVSLASSSTLVKDLQSADGKKTDKARLVGEALAKACIAQGIEHVVFDRNGYIYHGRIQDLADGAREGGLKF